MCSSYNFRVLHFSCSVCESHFLSKKKKKLLLQTIEMIEKEQREVERRPITKITHKGEIEIESQEPLKVTEPVEVRVKSYNYCN